MDNVPVQFSRPGPSNKRTHEPTADRPKLRRKSRRMPLNVEVSGDVPLIFLDKLSALGITFTKLNAYCADEQLVAVSETYQRVLGFIDDLKDVPVDLSCTMIPLAGDSIYDPDPWVPGQRTHLHELTELIRLHGSDGGMNGAGDGFFDSATGIPKLIKDLVDPPARCPLARAAPDGAYLFTLQLMFNNVWMSICIHRKRGF